MANVTEMPPPEATETADTAPETEATPQTPASPAPKKGSKGKSGPEPRFFDKVAAVAKADWGTRAFMYVYADEPVCNAKTFGTTRYMLKSSAPILDLEGLKQDYGSFKGWMTLNLRKTGKDQTDEVDRYEFEIYDPKHPPKIPKSAWANDARNKKWLDLLPPEKPAPSDGAATMLDAMKVYKEIRNEVKDETPAADPVDPTRSTLETMKLAKELFAPAVVESKPASDPLATAISLAQTMMQMKADNPMVEFMREQMGRQHDELMAMRKEMADARKAPETVVTAPKGFLETLIDFGGEAIKTRVVDSLFGGAKAAAEVVSRPGRMNTLEFVSENLPKALDTFSPLIQAAAHKIMNPANGSAASNPGAAIQPAVTGDVFQKFITEIVTPKMMMYFRADPTKEGGEGFADWIYAGWPEHFDRIQKFSHPMMPGLVGEAAIITAYKNTASIWSQLAPHELAFTQFVHGFCTYDPNAAESDNDPNIIDAEPEGPEDLDNQIEQEIS